MAEGKEEKLILFIGIHTASWGRAVEMLYAVDSDEAYNRMERNDSALIVLSETEWEKVKSEVKDGTKQFQDEEPVLGYREFWSVIK